MIVTGWILSLGALSASALEATPQQQESNSSESMMVSLADLDRQFYKTEIRQEIEVEFDGESVEQSLQMISSQTGLKLTYRGNASLQDQSVHLDRQIMSVSDALDRVLEGTGHSFLFSRDGYLLIRPTEVTLSDNFLQNTVTGQVRDSETGEPLPGVNVSIQGTTRGTVTDLDGAYSLSLIEDEEEAVLLFSYIGYTTQEVEIDGETSINVSLEPDLGRLDEVVVVGYGTVQRRDLTGSIKSVNMDDVPPAANMNLMQSLRGYAAGLNVQGGSAMAGDEPSFDIRGQTTLSASTSPLIVVDGIIYQGSISDINVDDVERVDVLKDASAAAVYGSRAANGVILITTKRGRGEGVNVNFSTYAGFQDYTNHPVRMMNAQEYATRLVDYNYMQDLYSWYGTNPTGPDDNGGKPVRPDVSDPSNVTPFLKSQEEVDNYLDGNEVNWIDEVTQRTPLQNYSLSVSGSTDLYNYYLSGSYTDQTGVLKNDKFNRTTLNTRIESDLTNWLRVGVNSSYTERDHSGMNVTMNYARNASPLVSVTDENGEYPMDYNSEMLMRHPLRNLLTDNSDLRDIFFLSGDVTVEIPQIEGLTYNFNYANTTTGRENLTFTPSDVYEASAVSGRAQVHNSGVRNWLINNIVSYNREFAGEHSINATLLYTRDHRDGNTNNITVTHFDNESLGYHNLGFGSQNSVSSSAWDENSEGYMGRINYGFMDRYLLTATIRRDGYSGFGEANKYANFRSMSAAWVASQESFMTGTRDWLDLLKFRLSYGENGNQGIGRYSSLARMGTTRYVYDGNPVIGVVPSALGNAELGWETTASINLGVDYSVLQNRISGAIDVYTSTTSDVLVSRSLPGATGYTNVWTNIGEVANKGFELELNTINTQGEVHWQTGFVFSLNRDEITKLYGDGQDDIGNQWFIGKPISAIYDYNRTGGVWTEEEHYNGETHDGFYPGQFRLEDRNGDGEIHPDDDRSIVGYATPNYRFSISNTVSYGNFTLSFLVNSIQGGNGYYIQDNSTFLEATSAFDYAQRQNLPAVRTNWLPDNGVTDAPAVYNYPSRESGNYQDRSFVRLQDVSLVYQFNRDAISQFGLGGLQLYISGKNLYTWTDWEGYDPELGGSSQLLMRSITGGLKLNL